MFTKELAYYRAHFREAVQRDGVICLECGAIFKYLPGHLCKHKLSSHEYGDKMRRSAIRNFRKAGLSESDGMKLSGHKTRSVYDRYDIIDELDSREAMKLAQAYNRKQSQRKVIPIKRKA